MEKLEQSKAPGKAPVLCSLALAVGMILSGCADKVENCLGKKIGKGEKDRVGKLVKNCDDRVDDHADTDNDDITREPGIDSRRFREATEACREASYGAAGLHALLIKKSRTLDKGSKDHKICVQAIGILEKMGKDVMSDAHRLHKNDL